VSDVSIPVIKHTVYNVQPKERWLASDAQNATNNIYGYNKFLV